MGEQRGFAHLLTAFRLQMYEKPCCFPLGGFENARLRKYTEKRKTNVPPNFHFAPFLLLHSLQSIWQLASTVLPPSRHGVMWSPSICSNGNSFLQSGQTWFAIINDSCLALNYQSRRNTIRARCTLLRSALRQRRKGHLRPYIRMHHAYCVSALLYVWSWASRISTKTLSLIILVTLCP